MATSLIKIDQLRKICPLLPEKVGQIVTKVINEVCPQYGMDRDILHEFLANVAHESREFTRYVEDMHYSAKRILRVWPSRFKTLSDALPYAYSPQRLACKVYGNRLGNTEPMDGWYYRGSGPIQMTGKAHFARFAEWMRMKFNIHKTEIEWAELIRTNHEMAMHSACWIFSIAKGLNDEAKDDAIRVIIRRINGAFIGVTERTRYYELCKKYLD